MEQEQDNYGKQQNNMKEIDNLLQRGEFGQAEQQLDIYINDNKADAQAYIKRSNVRLKNGKFIQALHDIEQAMLLDPTMPCCKSSYEHYQIKKGLMRMSNDI